MENKPNKVRRGEIVVFPAGSRVHYVLTPQELEALYEDDRRRGDTMDCAGESRIHHRQSSIRFDVATSVLVTGLTGVEWHSWYKKPSGLIKGVVTSGRNVGVEVSFDKGYASKLPRLTE